jgi:hypothetical protein
MTQCLHCFAVGRTDDYGICPECRAKARLNSTAGRIWAGHIKRIEAKQDAQQARQDDGIVYQFGQLPPDFGGWVDGR